ncbi:MAG: (Fe-S)-binding protein [Thiogranum sp.]|nr:(Fe-S)-binding protein [Thiogranum sp.]
MSDLSATDRCVKCGLCLPHCPTFRITGNEADSPRGRISLMQTLDQADTNWSPGLFRHLDQCLQCRACEAMCPSRVPFGALMDSARERLEPHRTRPLSARLLRNAGLKLLASPRAIRIADRLLAAYQLSRLDRVISALHLLPARIDRLHRMLPPRRRHAVASAATVSAMSGEVHLFPGCMGHLFDRQTLQAAQRLLERLGYRVSAAQQAGCCGALHQHSGETATAARLARSNVKHFAGDTHPVLVPATGCTAHLADYGRLYPGAAAAAFSERVSDVLHFVASRDLGRLSFNPLPERVAVYIPCSHRNALKQSRDIVDVISRIPGVDTVTVNPEGGCCGAAGSYMISQPALADQLRDGVIERLADCGSRLLVTTNIGCSLHIQAGLRQRGIDMEVLHPLTLLARQLAAR